MEIIIVMDNGEKYSINKTITERYSKNDIAKVLEGLGFLNPANNENTFIPIGLNDGKTDVLIRASKIQSVEYVIE